MLKQLLKKEFHAMIDENDELKSNLETRLKYFQKSINQEVLRVLIESHLNKVNESFRKSNPSLSFQVLKLRGNNIYLHNEVIYQLDKEDAELGYLDFMKNKDNLVFHASLFIMKVNEKTDAFKKLLNDTIVPFVNEYHNSLLRHQYLYDITYGINTDNTNNLSFNCFILSKKLNGKEVKKTLYSIKDKDMYKITNQSFIKSIINKVETQLNLFIDKLSTEYKEKVLDKLKEMNITKNIYYRNLNAPYLFSNNIVKVSFQFLDLNEESLNKFRHYHKNWINIIEALNQKNNRLMPFGEFECLEQHIHPSRINLVYPEDTLNAVEEVLEAVYQLHRNNVPPQRDYNELGNLSFVYKIYDEGDYTVYQYRYNCKQIYHKVFYDGLIASNEQKEFFWKEYMNN